MIEPGLLASRLNLDPGSWLAWIVVGLIAGAIAARVVAGRGFGCIADIVVGVAGAIIGGFLLSSLFGMSGNVGFFGSIVVAFIGAAALLAALKLVSGGRLRMGNDVYTPVGMKGWYHAIFRRESDGAEKLLSIDQLLRKMNDWM